MRVLGIDLETTSLDVKQARITELAAVVWDTEKNIPLALESTSVFDVDYPEISNSKITGFTKDMLEEFGKTPRVALLIPPLLINEYQCEYIVAHNGLAYDKRVMFEEYNRAGRSEWNPHIPWIDTTMDLPWYGKSRALQYLAADHGFLNPFPHRALTDVLTMLQIMAKYPFEEVLKRAQSPVVTVQALVSREMRHLAKEQGFRWQEVGDKFFKNCWVKQMKECDLDNSTYNFPVNVLA